MRLIGSAGVIRSDEFRFQHSLCRITLDKVDIWVSGRISPVSHSNNKRGSAALPGPAQAPVMPDPATAHLSSLKPACLVIVKHDIHLYEMSLCLYTQFSSFYSINRCI